MDTTTLEVPIALRDRIASAKTHPRQAYHEVLALAMDALERGASDALAPHRAAMRQLVAQHHGLRAWLFGSRAAGTSRVDSDVDVLVEFKDAATLFDQAALQSDLQDLLGLPVDVVSLGGLRGATRDRILAQRVPL